MILSFWTIYNNQSVQSAEPLPESPAGVCFLGGPAGTQDVPEVRPARGSKLQCSNPQRWPTALQLSHLSYFRQFSPTVGRIWWTWEKPLLFYTKPMLSVHMTWVCDSLLVPTPFSPCREGGSTPLLILKEGVFILQCRLSAPAAPAEPSLLCPWSRLLLHLGA